MVQWAVVRILLVGITQCQGYPIGWNSGYNYKLGETQGNGYNSTRVGGRGERGGGKGGG